ncbi:MAG: succinate dehydrogenase, hydrophobic membrane anchor protein [Paracoccaceae bacterium]|jgi:succinate dehydrogenase / fumarate reductase membrane anchor subunit
MRYLTARKRAEGKGAAHTGTEHHWSMTVSAVALAFMVPTWLYIFGSALGQPQEAVVAIFARPFPAILTALVLVVGMRHFAMGATMMIEDYARGSARKIGIIFAYSLSAVIVATGLFALVKIAI